MTKTAIASTALALAGATVAGRAGHWFITPMRHPHASAVETTLVGLQLLLGIAIIVASVVMQRTPTHKPSAADV